MQASDARVFSGVQPTGSLHLGNYLGALREWVRMQDEYDCIYCVVDLHAITLPHDPEELRVATREIVAAFIACGLDPQRSILFSQSRVRAHAQLAWILNCVARMGWLNRMTQFKDKAGKDREGASVGLYSYPVLQAADILAYRATHVPVGADQKQHIELARDIAQKFNQDYGAPGFFPLPEPMIRDDTARVMSLRDGTSKMSKSDPSDMSRINLGDAADVITRKIRRARTDPDPLPGNEAGLEGRPEAANLVGLLASLTGCTTGTVLESYEGRNFSDLKSELADAAVSTIVPIGEEIQRISTDPATVDGILAGGAERAAEIADAVVRDAEEVVGFLSVERRQGEPGRRGLHSE